MSGAAMGRVRRLLERVVRRLPGSLLAVLTLLGVPARAQVQVQAGAVKPSPRLSIAEVSSAMKDGGGAARQRLQTFQQLGIGMIRTSWGWRSLETAEGRWAPPATLPYLELAQQMGFRFKVSLDDLNAPPAWLLSARPEAQIRDSRGDTDRSDLSLWYPGLHDLLDAKMDRQVQMLVRSPIYGSVDFLIIGLGPAGEPRYPSPWLPGTPHKPENLTFWYYDDNARADFVRAMQGRYATPAAAGRAWRMPLADWADVRMPQAGLPSGMWADVLTWYRDSKRAFIRWQVRDVKAKLQKYSTGRTPQLIIFIPGSPASAQEWDRAVLSGQVTHGLVSGSDTDFLLDLAHEEGLWLQYTGVESEGNVSYVRSYLERHRYDIPVWGENAGGKPALAPDHLVDVIERQGLYGLEYVGVEKLLRADGAAQAEGFAAFSGASARLRQHFRAVDVR